MKGCRLVPKCGPSVMSSSPRSSRSFCSLCKKRSLLREYILVKPVLAQTMMEPQTLLLTTVKDYQGFHKSRLPSTLMSALRHTLQFTHMYTLFCELKDRLSQALTSLNTLQTHTFTSPSFSFITMLSLQSVLLAF